MSYKVEVLAIGDNSYCGNGLRFKNMFDVEVYAVDLAMR